MDGRYRASPQEPEAYRPSLVRLERLLPGCEGHRDSRREVFRPRRDHVGGPGPHLYATTFTRSLDEAPGTLEELLANAKIITEKKPGIAGITFAVDPPCGGRCTACSRSYGGGYFDKNWNPIINSPQSKAGAAMYVALCQQAPKGVTSYDWDEINTAMLAGKAAMFMDSSVIYSRLADPAQSTVVGKIKMVPSPPDLPAEWDTPITGPSPSRKVPRPSPRHGCSSSG